MQITIFCIVWFVNMWFYMMGFSKCVPFDQKCTKFYKLSSCYWWPSMGQQRKLHLAFPVHSYIMPIVFLWASTVQRDREADWVVHANTFSVLCCPPAALYRECSIHTSVLPVEALAFIRAPCAMGARCQCFETASQTLSKPWSARRATRTVFSAARPVLLRQRFHQGEPRFINRGNHLLSTFFLMVTFMD